MSPRNAALGFALLTLAYLGLFALLETRRNLEGLDRLLGVLPVLLSLTAAAWALRYVRWHWLLRRAGSPVPARFGFVAYLAGFAFTATPGKVGELLRVRYFARQGVPAWKVLSAFVYERACDLLVVLVLAMLALHDPRLLALAAGFVAATVSAVLLFGLRPRILTRVQAGLQRAGLRRCARVLRFLRDGLAGCRQWLRATDLLLSCGLALAAWGMTSLVLVLLARSTGIALPLLPGLGIYPLAMLVGAASMLPGGVGTTEAVIVALLAAAGADWQAAMLVALGARLVTNWFAMAAGLCALAWLEWRQLRRPTLAARYTRSTE